MAVNLLNIDPKLLLGRVGNDALSGGAGDDTLIGGAGDDTLVGGAGSDVYKWTFGDGDDSIFEGVTAGTDVLDLSTVSASQVKVTRSGNDIVITIAGSSSGAGGSITIKSALLGEGRGVERVLFKDAAWSAPQLTAQALTLTGTKFDETLSGTSAADTIIGGGGADVLRGGAGDDTYVWNRGDGNDTILEASGGFDTLLFGSSVTPDQVSFRFSGATLLVTIGGANGGVISVLNHLGGSGAGIEAIVFDNGASLTRDAIYKAASVATTRNDTLAGTSGNDKLIGGQGADRMYGGAGDDSYLWKRGDGSDTIVELADSGDDVLIFGSDVDHKDVRFRVDGDDLLVSIAPTASGAADGGVIRILNGAVTSAVESFKFVNGVEGYPWTWNFQTQLLQANGGASDDVYQWSRGDANLGIYDVDGNNDRLVLGSGIKTSDVEITTNTQDWEVYGYELNIASGDGAQGGKIILAGAFDWTSYGVERVDLADGSNVRVDDVRHGLTINGSDGADVFRIRGASNDWLDGGNGDDVYTWNRGDGNDVVLEFNGRQGGNDTLVLGPGIKTGSVSIQQTSADLVVSIGRSSRTASDGGQINLRGGGLENILFDDGTRWILDAGTPGVTGSASMQIEGTAARETIYLNANGTGGLKTSSASGGGGADTFVFRPGADATITDFNVADDKIEFGFGSTWEWQNALGSMRQVGSDLVFTNLSGGTLTLKDVAASTFDANRNAQHGSY